MLHPDLLTWVTWRGILHRPAGPAQRMSVKSSSFLLRAVHLLVRHLGGYGLVTPGMFAGLFFWVRYFPFSRHFRFTSLSHPTWTFYLNFFFYLTEQDQSCLVDASSAPPWSQSQIKDQSGSSMLPNCNRLLCPHCHLSMNSNNSLNSTVDPNV
jgi:hypothetical protein